MPPNDAPQSDFGIIGVSPAIQQVFRKITIASRHDCSVLITGETGTGKELVACAIHNFGLRRSRPFVPIDCTALVPTLFEAELFGYVRGAFTGAERTRSGLLASGHGGTVFLDEIGDLPGGVQSKLLRVLQEREVRQVGSTERKAVDIRVISATNVDLQRAIESGRFRQDLYFRLNVLKIEVPPLRERRQDIPLLTTYFLERFHSDRDGAPVLSSDAMARLIAHDWPGNVRELENAVDHGAAMRSGPTIQSSDLPLGLSQIDLAEVRKKRLSDEAIPSTGGPETIEEAKRAAIARAMSATDGNIILAARHLGIGKTTLYRYLKRNPIV